MIAIKPSTINDTTLISSSIAEPDIAAGEVEWESRSPKTDLLRPIHFLSFSDYYAWGINRNTGLVYRYTKRLVDDSFSFSVSAQSSSPSGICIANELIYILDGTAKIVFEYSISGVYSGNSFSVYEIALTPNGICWTGTEFAISGSTSGAIDTIYIYSYGVFSGSFAVGPSAYTIQDIDFHESFYYLTDFASNTILKISSSTLEISTVTSLASKMVHPYAIAVNDSIFVSSLNPASSFEFSFSGSFGSGYADGSEVVIASSHSRYRSASFTNDNPIDGVLKSPPTWIAISPTNKYAAFDAVSTTQSTSNLTQVVEIKPNEVIGGVAVFNMDGVDSVNITMTDPIQGVVYNRDVNMVDNSAVISWGGYFFSPIISKSEFVVLDLPPYVSATTKITIAGGGEVGVGSIVVGGIFKIGTTYYDGTSVKELNFDTWTEDAFGNLSIIKKPGAKLVNFGVKFDEQKLNYTAQSLEKLRGIPAVYVGSDINENDYTLVYGVKRESEIDFNPVICTVPIQVRGFI